MSDEDLRARITRAITVHGTVVAKLNPDGSTSLQVPTNDLDRARERRATKGKKWRGATNELIVSHANPDCKACGGTGILGTEADGEVCEARGCAVELFAAAYRGRLRHNRQKNRLEVFV